MSSVQSAFFQPLTKYLHVSDNNSADAWTYSNLVEDLANYDATVVGNIITFPTEDSFRNWALPGESVELDEAITLRDMGKKLYVGVQGLESQIFEFSLVQSLNFNDRDSSDRVIGGVFYVLTAVDATSLTDSASFNSYSVRVSR